MSPTKADGQTEDYSGTQLGEVSHTSNMLPNLLALDSATSARSASLLVLILAVQTVDATRKVHRRNVLNYEKAGIGNSMAMLDW